MKSKAMSDTTPSTKIFDFFGLASELRDQIYEELLEPLKSTALYTGRFSRVTVSAHHIPHTNLALVSRRFKKEYYARFTATSQISIDNLMPYCGHDNRHAYLINLPPLLATSTRKLHINLRIGPARDFQLGRSPDRAFVTPSEVVPHLFQQMESLQYCSMYMHYQPSAQYDLGGELGAAKQHFTSECERFASMRKAKVTSMKLFVGRENESWFETRGGPLLTWSQETGIVEDVSDEKPE